jgi:PAS domain S-box-containing protein
MDMEDPRYPSPNLYDLVLLLGAEPGLTPWWNCVTKIMHDWYGADRATLAVPADASDIENVPWGQKTTFNASLDHQVTQQNSEQKESTEKHDIPKAPERPDNPPTTLIPEKRPKLPLRHSFSGHERQKRDVSFDNPTLGTPSRPRSLLRTVSHAPQAVGRPEHPLRQVSPASFDGASIQPPLPTPLKETSFVSDPEFSSFGGDTPPPTAVFPVLRALDHEPDALIDNTGINRVLERGRLVTLTRDYSSSMPTSRNSSTTEPEEEQPVTAAPKHVSMAGQESHKPTTLRGRAKLTARSLNLEQSDSRLQPRYEEYEQFPSSPWAQSPAPSPAIQNDPEENPFFTAGNVDEETFNPSTSAQDYSKFAQVEAIGVDRASTITHIPLMHPILSQLMQPQESATPSATPSMTRRPSDRSDQSDQSKSTKSENQRKAPIAILSILSPTVPYPRNLTDSLRYLGPHLATSFSNAWQFTNAQAQVSGIRNRRYTPGHQVGLAPMSDQESLDGLLHLDLEHVGGSTGGSMTSPSDYSGPSKYSPGGSLGGTPSWDPSNVGFSSKQSVTSTPGLLAGSEAIESYFDSKRRTTRAMSQSSTGPSDHSQRISDKRNSKRASVHSTNESVEDDVTTLRTVKVDDTVGQTNSTRRPRMTTPQVSHVRAHSLLHSYGADFSSSFQSLPAATTPGNKAQVGPPGHARRNSIDDNPEMPPPSESLLRTIIDSLPVQIFTALPTTGALTWVNTKFLVYRGQDSTQVLQEPWDAIHPEDRATYLEQWTKSLRTGQQLQQKVRLQRFDGNYRWFYVRVAPLKNKRQQIVHWIGTNMDFHDQHLAELNSARQQETAASEAKYRALANSSPQVVFVVSNRRGLTFCNSQWITYSGQTEAQAHVNGFLEHVHPDDVVKCKLPEMGEDGSMPTNVPTSMPPDHVRKDSSSSSEASSETERGLGSPGGLSPDRMEMPQAKLSKLASTGILKVTKDAHGRPSYSTEVRLRSKEGEYRWHLVRVLLEKSLADDSEEETWYGTATDINDHKLLEQTLKETMDAKTRFLSNMSHEIRTPLNGISGMVNFLLDSPLISEQLEHVNIIKASTDSLLNLINDILDLSKVEAGMIKLTMEWLHIPSLLEEVNDLNMGLAIQKGLELNYLMEEDVPVMVKGDKFRIRQVLLNVVGNAIKFTEKGEVFVRCRLSGADHSGEINDNETMVQFEVIDSGRGFTEQEAKYLFKRFSQIDASSTRQHGGTGLGLAISMQFVELHGGKMDARSVPGRGSTFFFTIKFGVPTEVDRPVPPALTPSTPAVEPVPPAPQTFAQSSPLQNPISSHIAATTRIERISSIPSDRSDSIKSPVPSLTTSDHSRESPYLSSGSSDPSLTGRSSLRSERSAASSFLQESTLSIDSDQIIKLALPLKRPASERGTSSDDSSMSFGSDETLRPPEISRSLSPLGSAFQPPMYSILVVCPLVHSREATIRHIKNTLPEGIPHQITGQPSLVEAQRMIGGDDPVLFTHIVLILHETSEVIAIMDQILTSTALSTASIVVVSDPAQKKELIKDAPAYDYEQLFIDRRLQFIYRPLKPSKFGIIFDPQKQRDSSTDRNQDSAQAVVVSQKLVFEELKRRVGNKGNKVLLVEDNKINQTVSFSCYSQDPIMTNVFIKVVLKFLAKIAVDTETVLDGVQCTETVFSKPAGYYSIILVC